jgi:hypothetical protein
VNPVPKKTPPKGPRSLAELLQCGDIAKLLSQAAERRGLVTDVKASLPADEAEHVVSASTDAVGRLTIGVDSATWAARIRYRVRELGPDDIQVRVVPKGR